MQKEVIKEYSRKIAELKREVNKVVIGQEHMLNSVIIALLSNGHILLEGVPGLAKSLVVETVAKAVEAKFQRIQFTPDLMPSDITGSKILDQEANKWRIEKGPIFNNLVLADEINRASPKVQSALLESMQERQVSIETRTYPLEKPFMVMATMNPLEQTGTYNLSEAQVDRFMLKIDVGYPALDEMSELLYLKNSTFEELKKQVKKVINLEDILNIQGTIHQNIHVGDRIRDYINTIWITTIPPDRRNKKDVKPEDLKPENYPIDYGLIKVGSSPRGAEYLQNVAKTYAFMNGYDFVTPEHIAYVAKDVLRHRILLSHSAERENISSDGLIDELLSKTKIPDYKK